jgi:hypothetical protein
VYIFNCPAHQTQSLTHGSQALYNLATAWAQCFSFWVWSLSSGLCTCKADALPLEPHLQIHFCFCYFGDGVSWSICLGWPRTSILRISSSQVAKITVVRQRCLASLVCFCFIYLFLWYWGLNSGPTPWATPPTLFGEGFFWDRVSQIICPGWLWTEILLVSVSWVGRVTGVSHRHWTLFVFKCFVLLLVLGIKPRASLTW